MEPFNRHWPFELGDIMVYGTAEKAYMTCAGVSAGGSGAGGA